MLSYKNIFKIQIQLFIFIYKPLLSTAMRKILGLDIGTNSIGGALITINEFGKQGSIEWMGSRIIPLDGDSLTKFENGGQVETKAANRRVLRMTRRLKQRYKLRRSRLIKVFKTLKWIDSDFPENFKREINSNSDFSFNINNFLPLSDATRRDAYAAFGTENISEDWIVYYLRKKALNTPITLQELARILYMLNQRRGFKSSRKDIKAEETDNEEKYPKIEKWIEYLKVSSVEEISKDKDKTIYKVIAGTYEGYILRTNKPDWENKTINLEITRKTTKNGEVSFAFKTADVTEWEKQKDALNKDVSEFIKKGICKTIGDYFLMHLIEDKNYRIRQRIVERHYYKSELDAIWKEQVKHHSILSDKTILPCIAKVLYNKNVEKQKEISANDLLHVFANDIIYYQRSLKSQKNSIDECRFEKKKYMQNGVEYEAGVKVAPKSSPEFQEFRIWQDISNLRIIEKEKTIDGKQQINIDVTEEYINTTSKEALFELFDSSAEITENAVLKTVSKKISDKTHFVNLFANREKLKGNETKAAFRKVFKKHNWSEKGEQLLSDSITINKLWHIIYSLQEDNHIESALNNLNRSNKLSIPEPIIKQIAKLPELPKQYASYSTKTIKKLLPLMRSGCKWQKDNITEETKDRIDKIIHGEFDEHIDDRTRDFIKKLGYNTIDQFAGLPVWLATYIVYGRHAERVIEEKYSSPEDINIAKLIPANSLRNPFVEQIVRETLQVVKGIFIQFGQPDEIHIELARDLKKTAEEKEKIASTNNKNNIEKERIRKLLIELKEGNSQSLADIEKFRIWKNNGGFESAQKFDELFNKKNEFVSIANIEKYRIWANQHHLSPYTGKPIPLSKLFTKEYEVEHIFPRSRFFDDSFANKIICEAGVNKEKDKRTARLFIQQYSGRTFVKDGQTFTILTEEDYVAHCKRIFTGKKQRNLLAEEIPTDFISRQLNDTRYITKKLSELLYPIVKDKEGIVYTGGSITSELKEKWGLHKVWKEIIKPRFERLETITGEQLVLQDEQDRNKFHFAKEYKRVDHRHHALDALIIAATTREHIRYLNTLSAADDDEKRKLRYGLVKNGIRDFVQPWPQFTEEAKERLNAIVVSHKATNRVVTKPFNHYLKWVEINGKLQKKLVPQQQPNDYGKSWVAVRKSMFKEPQGIIYLKELVDKRIIDAVSLQISKLKHQNIKGQIPHGYIYDQELRPLIKNLIFEFNGNIDAIKKHLTKKPIIDNNGNKIEKVKCAIFKEYAAKRVSLDKSFDVKKINKIPYADKSPLAALLKNHLASPEYGGKPDLAFQGEGFDILTKKAGTAINKVTIYEEIGKKIKLNGKLVETDEGGNVYFIIEENKDGQRTKMYTLPLIEAIERLANKLPLVDNKEGHRHIILSPNELVYVPDEGESIDNIDWNDKKPLFGKIYKMVSCTGSKCLFVPHFISKSLDDEGIELGSGNKSERAWDGIVEYKENSKGKESRTDTGRMIKEVCLKIKIDRLGNLQLA